MTNQERIKIITSFQSNPLVHPLTCGVNSLHQNLAPVDCGDDEVILKCLDCGYKQHIDDEFLALLAELDTRQREFGKTREDLLKQHRYVKEY